MRDMVFISHANPEDNELARWLALKLAANGYPVWCDLTKLIGGETFWTNIEVAVRERTAKFLYVLSRSSNTKKGPRDELALAAGVERSARLTDFIVPLWIDDLPPSEFNVEIFRRNAIRFQDGWANGLAKVLEKLEEDRVAQKPSLGPSAVADWWRGATSNSSIVLPEPELLSSNWYPIQPVPLYFHELSRKTPGPIKPDLGLPYPAVLCNQYLVSFAPAEDFDGRLGPSIFVSNSHQREIGGRNRSTFGGILAPRDEMNAVIGLLRVAMEGFLTGRALCTYTFSGGYSSFYFIHGTVQGNRMKFKKHSGEASWRAMVGYKSRAPKPDGTPSVRHWHFSLEPRPTISPFLGFTMKPHVLFSDDGKTIWQSDERLHRARRSQCKDWWNDKWRDMTSAAVQFLAGEGDQVALAVGSSARLGFSTIPVLFESPVSFDESSAIDQETDDRPDDSEDDR